jgi:hypothetical protein
MAFGDTVGLLGERKNTVFFDCPECGRKCEYVIIDTPTKARCPWCNGTIDHRVSPRLFATPYRPGKDDMGDTRNRRPGEGRYHAPAGNRRTPPR